MSIATVALAPTPAEATGTELHVGMSDRPDAARRGGRLEYSVRYGNRGAVAAEDVRLRFDLSPDTSVANLPPGCAVLDDRDLRDDEHEQGIECRLGTLAPGSEGVLALSLKVSADARSGSNTRFIDCDESGDLRGAVNIGTYVAEQSDAGSFGCAVTRVSGAPAIHVPDTCGNGNLDSGEECDDGRSEDCANAFDDDGDGMVDIADDDCHGPGATCSDRCTLEPAPLEIAFRSSALRFGKGHSRDMLVIHALFSPYTRLNPTTEDFTVAVLHGSDPVFRSTLFAGDIQQARRRPAWQYLDPFAAFSGGRRSGMHTVKIRLRLINGLVTYAVTAIAYGDFSAATTGDLTAQIGLGGDVAFTSAPWRGRYGRRWRLWQQ